jgi:hypothetical protein
MVKNKVIIITFYEHLSALSHEYEQNGVTACLERGNVVQKDYNQTNLPLYIDGNRTPEVNGGPRNARPATGCPCRKSATRVAVFDRVHANAFPRYFSRCCINCSGSMRLPMLFLWPWISLRLTVERIIASAVLSSGRKVGPRQCGLVLPASEPWVAIDASDCGCYKKYGFACLR